jgi:hypothetical protein
MERRDSGLFDDDDDDDDDDASMSRFIPKQVTESSLQNYA